MVAKHIAPVLKLVTPATPHPSRSTPLLEDDIIDSARAQDVMRDELHQDWSQNGKQGTNPDELPAAQVNGAYAKMLQRQREQATKDRSR